jgi:hypothetical protein
MSYLVSARITETVSFADECSGSSELKRGGGRARSAHFLVFGRAGVRFDGRCRKGGADSFDTDRPRMAGRGQ